MSNAVTFENVNVKLGDTLVLKDVNAHIPQGGSTAIIGPNGAGKTSLALALLGQEPYS
ncbi:MAG: ATP-binding cassette domain-containing protein, partial [Lentisphaeria bacterium]|nr:ATP-binding cassette domain-containing protein [Lentisphaeria bacterium]